MITRNSLPKAWEISPRLDRATIFRLLGRAGLIVVLGWIASLKAARYEAGGVTPIAAASSSTSFSQADPNVSKNAIDSFAEMSAGKQ